MLEVNINFSKKHLNILNEEMIAQRIERFLKDKDTLNSNLIKILIFVIFLFAHQAILIFCNHMILL